MFMLDDNIMQQLRATFKVEAGEHIQTMNRILLALEKGPDEEERIELLEEIFRAAHSLKGAAGAADMADVESTAHRLESAFFASKKGQIELTPDLCDVLYDAIDAVSLIIEASLEGGEHGLDLPHLHARLEAAKEGQVVSAFASQPAAAEMEEEIGHEEPEQALAQAEPSTQETSSPPEVKTPQARKHKEQSKGSVLSQSKGSGPVIEETIRVAVDKLDTLMTQAGELLVAGLKIDQRLQEVEALHHAIEDWLRSWRKSRAALGHLPDEDGRKEMQQFSKFLDSNQQRMRVLAAQIGDLWRSFSRDALHLSRVTEELGEGVMKVRMLPASTVFDTFPRLVRDLARDSSKQIDLQIEGGETELDRRVLEEIKDPLVHILRNAVDHGIKSPEKREAAGKPRQATITVSASQKGSSIVIKVTDDGEGIDVQRVKEKALQVGLIDPDDVETMSDDEAMRLIFASGLSTAAIVTDISGRGVGMDVVRKNVESLHGHVDVDSTLGEGTTMTLVLPLTLATTQELLVRVAGQTFGIPVSAVERIHRIQQQDIRMVEGKEAILVGDEPISLVHLSDVLELQCPKKASFGKKMPTVILNSGKKRIAFLVDAVVDQQESVVKNLGKQLSRVRNVAGVTILGSGQVIMTLNPVDVVKSARGLEGKTNIAAEIGQTRTEEAKRFKILVVDDSLTTRNLEKTILETAGYEVSTATDGLEALNILQSNGCDLVVSDVLMPRLDGFQLTATMRENPDLSHIPVVLVTALGSREDKERGIEVGADAYIVKRTFDQENLLQTIERLI